MNRSRNINDDVTLAYLLNKLLDKVKALFVTKKDADAKYVSKSGDTMTGSLFLDGKDLPSVGSYRTLRIYGNKKSKPSEIPAVTSNSPYGSIGVYDVDDNRIFYNECTLNSAGRVYASYVVHRPMDDGTFVNNGFYLHVNSDGTVSMSFSNNDVRDAWLSSLGLLSTTNFPPSSWHNKITGNAGTCRKYGQVIMFNWNVKQTGAVAKNATLATFATGTNLAWCYGLIIKNNAVLGVCHSTNNTIVTDVAIPWTSGTEYFTIIITTSLL